MLNGWQNRTISIRCTSNVVHVVTSENKTKETLILYIVVLDEYKKRIFCHMALAFEHLNIIYRLIES